ncbi:MAG: TRAM domain-containing protein [Clostridia bacterium]|nr:TRAM domain-containing protein [Clostridia bacterium]
MLNNVIRASFAVVGVITGFTLTRTVFSVNNINMPFNLKAAIFLTASVAVGSVFYLTGNKIIEHLMEGLDKLEQFIQSMTLYELTVSAVGLIAGLIVANLFTIPINNVEIIGMPLSVIANILFGCVGVAIAMGKRNEPLFDSLRNKKGGVSNNKAACEIKLLDTSIIIDGRIVDICRSGFVEGELVIPGFVLEELRHIADSHDSLKRNRGRRGLDVLNILQKELEYPIRVESIDVPDGGEVDDKLLKAAKKFGYKIMTIDYNLSKVASVQGVQVLNINELANAMKPIALPGEEMVIQVIKDGKENGQGVGYLDDGTMIVVEGGRRHIGETVSVMVTSVLQTAAGRMIFAKPKCQMEKAM